MIEDEGKLSRLTARRLPTGAIPKPHGEVARQVAAEHVLQKRTSGLHLRIFGADERGHNGISARSEYEAMRTV